MSTLNKTGPEALSEGADPERNITSASKGFMTFQRARMQTEEPNN